MKQYAQQVWLWFTHPEHEWRSWASHAGLALVLSLVFTPYAAATFYVLREIEQIGQHWMEGAVKSKRDYFMDAYWPVATAAVVAVVQAVI